MNKKLQILAALMALTLCAGALTACGNNSSGNNSGNNSGSNVSDNGGAGNDTADNGETSVTINTVAQVTAIHEDGSLELLIYSGSGNISDFAAVDFSAYTATEETESLTIPDTGVLSTAENGSLTAASLSDIAVGDMLVITQDIDTDEVLQAVRYAADTVNTGDNGEAADNDADGDSSETADGASADGAADNAA